MLPDITKKTPDAKIQVVATESISSKCFTINTPIIIKTTIDININKNQLRLACNSFNNGYWVFDQENFEIDIIQEFLPQALSEEEVDEIVNQAITQTGAASIKDMGKVMGILKPQLQGKADMSAVSAMIKSSLSG